MEWKNEVAITVNSENDRTTAKHSHSFLSELFRELMLFTLSLRLSLLHIYAKICAYDEISYTIDRKEYSLSMATRCNFSHLSILSLFARYYLDVGSKKWPNILEN